MKRPFDIHIRYWLILILLVMSNTARSNVLGSDNKLHGSVDHSSTISNTTSKDAVWNAASDAAASGCSATDATWNTNCSFEEVAALMKGPDQDLIRFSVSARAVAGASPVCADLSGATVSFKYDGTTYNLTAGSSVDVILASPDTLKNSVTITDGKARFNCSNGGALATSCDVISRQLQLSTSQQG